MEISLISKDSLKIKGKRASFIVDPYLSKAPRGEPSYAAALVLNSILDESQLQSDTVAIDSPGEYEIGGIKMNATRNDGGMIYNPIVDGVEILIGKLTIFEKTQSKLKEQHIVVVYVDSVTTNASFITSLASHVVIFYGSLAKELAGTFGKETNKHAQKFAVTSDKLPQEVETIILE